MNLTRNQMIIPANIASKIVTTEMGQDCKIEPLATLVKTILRPPFRVTTTTPGTRITGINLLYALRPYDVFVIGKTNSSARLLLL